MVCYGFHLVRCCFIVLIVFFIRLHKLLGDCAFFVVLGLCGLLSYAWV